MFNFGWTELLLIAVVAIVVIGPKELPETLRGLGRGINKLRRMAGEFQGQFNEALREANLEDVKKEFDAIRQSTSALTGGISPAAMARNEIRNAITGPGSSASASSSASSSSLIDPGLTSSSAVATAVSSPAAEEEKVAIPSAFAQYPAFKRYTA